MSLPPVNASLREVLRARFALDAFRPHQEEVCAAAANGEDVLLVMPTGSGKSMCYQLPGIVRGGTTLVISPLIGTCPTGTVLVLRSSRFHALRAL